MPRSVIRMATPWQHPTNRKWYFRGAVPEALRAILGCREIKRSLDTRDPELAKIRFNREVVACDTLFAQARDRLRSAALIEARRMVADYFDHMREHTFDAGDTQADAGLMLTLLASSYFDFILDPPGAQETRPELLPVEWLSRSLRGRYG